MINAGEFKIIRKSNKEGNMKNKILVIMFLSAIVMVGCNSRSKTNSVSKELEQENSIDQEKIEEKKEDSIPEFNLDLTGMYLHTSGAGGWKEELTVDKSGHFEGLYQDADVDQMTYLGYSGNFINLQQEEDLKYSAQVENVKREEVDQEKLWTPSKAEEADFEPNLQDNHQISIFLKGYPITELTDEQKIWLQSVAPLVNVQFLEENYIYDEDAERGYYLYVEHEIPEYEYEPEESDSPLQTDLTSGSGTWSSDTVWDPDLIENDRVRSIHFNPDMTVELEMGYEDSDYKNGGQYTILDDQTIQFRNLRINGEVYNDTPIQVTVIKGKDLDPNAEIGYSSLRIEALREDYKDILFDLFYLLEK